MNNAVFSEVQKLVVLLCLILDVIGKHIAGHRTSSRVSSMSNWSVFGEKKYVLYCKT